MSKDVRTMRIDGRDNLVVALVDLAAGETIEVGGRAVRLVDAIRAKHKFACERIESGGAAVMYGVLVGRATGVIEEGGAVTTGNLVHAAEAVETGKVGRAWEAPDVSVWQGRTWNGFLRSSGDAGTQNVWLVVPLVFCENRNLELMRQALLRPLGYAKSPVYEGYVRALVEARSKGEGSDGLEPGFEGGSGKAVFENVDGVKFLTHTLGCGGTDADAEALAGLLAGYVTHPNVAGATVLSLGCQKTQIALLESAIAGRQAGFDRPVRIFEQQKCASERDLMGKALRATFEGMAEANELRREAVPLSKLVLGMECGGSDGFSGISANPLMGEVADRVVGLGGKVMLAEFPELCGAEQDLVERCADEKVAGRFLELMGAYGAAAERVGSGFDSNPSPGNVADGLITDAIKSCGAARKGGTSPVVGVLDYPEPCRRDGLSLLCTPGGDVESTTALAGSGANLMMFSTGLGTPTGNPVTPVMKLSSNTELAERMPDVIDFDAGPLVAGEAGMGEMAGSLLDLAVRVASGEVKTRAQELGQDDFIPWKRGVSL
ncbi:MAG: altronate dehydratase family protein [Verrucomicrobiales bacterium]|nr:altronate dehydratase family protein [Verrucomicrobiales bacterium]